MDESAEQFVADSARFLFDVQLSYIPQERLVTLPGVHGVVVNTMSMSENNNLLEDLCYFNFLEMNGLVIDTNLHPLQSLLLQEAESVGAWTIPGHEIVSATDAQWSGLISGKSYSPEEYDKFLLEKLQSSSETAAEEASSEI
ncbi:MAG: hypothetical protein R2827_04455 [Bdellovibrionales bacterium]